MCDFVGASDALRREVRCNPKLVDFGSREYFFLGIGWRYCDEGVV